MPAGYILNTPLEEISLHLQLLARLDTDGIVLDVYNRPGDDYSELTICAYDDPTPGMLAKITGVLYGCSTDIHRARVYTVEQPRPVILDTLCVRGAGHQLSENRVRRLRAGLRSVLLGEETLDGFLKKTGKLPPAGIPLDSIELRNELSPEHTVVHVVARDLQGLLFLMTRALSRCGLDIHSAKVATWNARAENNFYVTTEKGSQMPDGELSRWRDRLSRALLGLDAEREG
jgi:[protein-PII] uridylyltransferase